jgi:hypothetical protein
VPETFGFRIAQPTSNSHSQSAVHLEFAESPAPGDEVSEADGLRLFVAAELAEPLTKQAIDTQDSSASGSNLVLREQAELED